MNIWTGFFIGTFAGVLFTAWASGKISKTSKIRSFILMGLAVIWLFLNTISGYIVFKSQGIVAEEHFSDLERTAYMIIGHIKMPDNTYVAALWDYSGREYVYRFKSLPPKGFVYMKTLDGIEHYTPEI